MSTAIIDLQEWLTSFTEAASDLAANHLRFENATERPDFAIGTGVHPAVYVAILGSQNSMHLGLSATVAGCHALARAFLGLRGGEDLTEREVIDGMSEILNILAGKVKSRMAARDGSLKLGLPMFVAGAVGHGEGVEKAVHEVFLGPVPCRLHVFRQTRTA